MSTKARLSTAQRIPTARRYDAECRVSLSKRRSWHADEGEATTTTDTATGSSNAGGATTTGGAQQAQQAATITQEEANRLIGEARKKGRETALTDLLKELGFEKADELKSLVTEAKQRKEADMTEAQKAQAAREAAEKEAADLKAQLEAERQARVVEKRDSVIRDALRDARARNVDKTFAALLVLKASEVAAVLKDDGTLDAAKVKALVDAARKDYAEDFGASGPGTPSFNDGRAPEPDKAAKERALQDLQRRQRSGW